MKNGIQNKLYMVIFLVMFVLAFSPAKAGQITSSVFSIGYGYTGINTWNTTETDSNNTPSTQGDFSLNVDLSCTNLSNSGPGFPDRVLTDNGNYTGWVGNAGGGDSDQFRAEITASYNGPEPNGVDTDDPEYRVVIEIMSISVYGGSLLSSSEPNFQWVETTPGRSYVSEIYSPAPNNSWALASSYEKLAWDPPEFGIYLPAGAGYNDPVARTFEIQAVDSSDRRYIDGFEIEARIRLEYKDDDGAQCDTFPEADINEDCYVNFKDIAVLADEWLECTDAGAPCNYTGGIITSADFSIGYGYEAFQIWGTTETDSNNTPTTQGNFTFSPVLSSMNLSNTGPGFPNRVLTDNVSFVGRVGDTSGGYKDQFLAEITASYDGPEPIDVDLNNPNYRLMIEVTSVSVYGIVLPSSSVMRFRWNETTPGHTRASDYVYPTPASDWKIASNYEQIAWDPYDYGIGLPGGAGYNDSVSRSFAIIAEDSGDLRGLDGFEIEGRVHLLYNIAP